MKSILVILVHFLLFLLTRGKRQYLVEVAENASLQEEHHGNKTKHYLVEVSGNTSLPRKHLDNKEGKKRREKKMERKRRGDKKRDYQDIHTYEENDDEAEVGHEAAAEDEADKEDEASSPSSSSKDGFQQDEKEMLSLEKDISILQEEIVNNDLEDFKKVIRVLQKYNDPGFPFRLHIDLKSKIPLLIRFLQFHWE